MGCIWSLLGMQTNHSKYYFKDGNIIFQAEKVRFKIHKYLISQGALGTELPRPVTNPDEGLAPTNPIILPGVTAKEFECLLDVLYHPGLANVNELGSRTLMKALDISDRYGMEDVSNRITRQLQSRAHNSCLATSFAMMACCVKHPNRFPRAFVTSQFDDICTSSERISPINITELSGRLTANVMQGRELVREGQQPYVYGAPSHWAKPRGWDTFLDEVFPRTQAAGGWQIGPLGSRAS